MTKLTHDHRIRRNTVSGRPVGGVRRVKVWVARTVAGDYYATKVRIGWFRQPHGPSIKPLVLELLRVYETAKPR